MASVTVFEKRLVLAVAAFTFAGVTAAFILLERPGLGIAHGYYLPVCLVALVTDATWGALAGLLGTGLYAGAVLAAPGVPSAHLLTSASLIRLVAFVSIGALLGWYASRNRTLLHRLHAHALEDFLTGVGNARRFDDELARRCAEGKTFTLVLADVDDFARINETHGHEAGNAALKRVAEVLVDAAPPTAALARIGGDEFALVTHLPPEQARHVFARAGRVLADDNLALSIGTTSYPEDGSTAVELFRKADDRLFAAKLVSRNRRTVVARVRTR
jgi:diguanylate cyclase (GGDEF)-like protein